jgi:hypothetical protein
VFIIGQGARHVEHGIFCRNGCKSIFVIDYWKGMWQNEKRLRNINVFNGKISFESKMTTLSQKRLKSTHTFGVFVENEGIYAISCAQCMAKCVIHLHSNITKP